MLFVPRAAVRRGQKRIRVGLVKGQWSGGWHMAEVTASWVARCQ
jgi:hypothetical protein